MGPAYPQVPISCECLSFSTSQDHLLLSVLLMIFVIQTNRLFLHFQNSTRHNVECVYSDPSLHPAPWSAPQGACAPDSLEKLPVDSHTVWEWNSYWCHVKCSHLLHLHPDAHPCLCSAWWPGHTCVSHS